MSDKSGKQKVLDLLEQNELAINKLYKLFAVKFPDQKKLWQSLAAEELIHADWINKLHLKVQEGTVVFQEDRFEEILVQSCLNLVNMQIERFSSEDLPLKEAFRISVQIESQLTEKAFFKVFTSDDQDLKNLLRALEEAFLLHKEKLESRVKETE